jgi:hypothetical protein
MAIKHIPIEEFRRLGFLQEANRLFFHPHGLALEVTVVDEDGWDADSTKVIEMAFALAEPGETRAASVARAIKVLNQLHPPGSVFISGVWDARDDPEGVLFGRWEDDDVAKAAAVRYERDRHRAARSRLFGEGDSDVEPLDFVYAEVE